MLARLFGRKARDTERQAEGRRLMAEAGVLFKSGELDVARQKMAVAVELLPDETAVLRLYGAILSMLGERAAALNSFRKAIALSPRDADLHFDYGNALRLAGELEDAEVAYRQALRLSPALDHGWRSLGNLLLEMKRPAEAMTAYEQALAHAPTDHEARKGLGRAAFHIRDFAQARNFLDPLLDHGLLSIEERYFLGTSLLFLGDIEAATKSLVATYALAPDEAAVGQMLACAHLFGGRWSEGFRLFERRLDAMRRNPEAAEMKAWMDFVDRALATIPTWSEGGCAGKRLLIWNEQGLGDTLMLLRLLPVLVSQWQAASVTLLCTPPVAALAQATEGIAYIVRDKNWKATAEEFDAHCSLMSLPHLMGITPEAIPGRVPYLHIPQSARARWDERVGALSGLKVGVAWAGNPKLTLDSLRSLALVQLEPLMACPGVSFVSLQKDAAARDELRLSGWPLHDWMDECEDFFVTAALIDQLDLVISVDTAVAHLAGAMGKPVWMLNRFESEWRWMRGREDSVWYPGMRLFNQTEPRNWGPVIDRMAEELTAMGRSAVR